MDTICLANGQRQTATLNCEITTMWETKPRMTPQKTLNVNGTGTVHKASKPADYMMMTIV
jgi:hypothetical protein